VADTLLDIRGLKTWFKVEDGMVRAVDGVDLHIDRGETGCSNSCGTRSRRSPQCNTNMSSHATGNYYQV
jgi:ABC-type antimicrobial peptide transport system ATPase subunit